jgi:dynein heavy chain
MSSLTEAVNQSKGKTVLYIPPERRITESSKAALDKDLVQRLESTVIQWTRQIKEVVNNQDNNHNEDGVGPLDEIKFWHNRCVDLSGSIHPTGTD